MPPPETIDPIAETTPDKPGSDQGTKVEAGEQDQPAFPNQAGEPLGFRATMKAIVEGEKDPAKLRAIAAEAENPEPENPEPEKDPLAEPEKVEPEKVEPEKVEPEKVEPIVEDKTPAVVPDITEAEMKVLPAREQKRIKHFIAQTKAAEEKAAAALVKAEAAEKEAAELREKTGKVPADLETKLSELQKLQRRFDMEHDPEIQEKFTKRIMDGEKVVAEALKTTPLYGPWLESRIKEFGTFAAFVKSKKTYSIKGADGPEEVTGADIYKRVIDSMPATEADILRQTIADQARTEKEKARFIEEESTKINSHFDTVIKEREEKQANWGKRLKATEEGAKLILKDASEKIEWLKDIVIKDDEKPESKKKLEEDKKFRAELRESLQGVLSNPVVLHAAAMITDKEAATNFRDMVLDAHRVIAVDRELAQAKKQIEQLNDELKQARGASVTTTRVGAIPRTAPATTATDKPARLAGETDLRYSIRTGLPAPTDS